MAFEALGLLPVEEHEEQRRNSENKANETMPKDRKNLHGKREFRLIGTAFFVFFVRSPSCSSCNGF
jgi:hypothetical protein